MKIYNDNKKNEYIIWGAIKKYIAIIFDACLYSFIEKGEITV